MKELTAAEIEIATEYGRSYWESQNGFWFNLRAARGIAARAKTSPPSRDSIRMELMKRAAREAYDAARAESKARENALDDLAQAFRRS